MTGVITTHIIITILLIKNHIRYDKLQPQPASLHTITISSIAMHLLIEINNYYIYLLYFVSTEQNFTIIMLLILFLLFQYLQP